MPTGKRKKKTTKVNNILLCILLAVMAVSAGALGWNMYKINSSAEDTDNDIKEDKIDEDFLEDIEEKDCVFPDIDYMIYS